MIDLTINEKQLEKTATRCKERNIIVPTFEQMRNPELIPAVVKEKLKDIGLWDISPYNLFRITWKNEAKEKGGLFGGVNYMEIPPEISGVDARIVCLVGKWFPTGAHKVGAAFGCLAPRLVTGQFEPSTQRAVWPSTGNYCRGGAYDSALLACESIAILPEGMSKERFEWLSKVAGEVIATPGCESNVKEIYDKCWELRKTRKDVVIFNQFDEMGNHLWHYDVTGHAMEEVIRGLMKDGSRYAGVTLTTGSAGTIASGDYLKKLFPTSKIAACEALQCPTLLMNGYGGHRIEGIGDKHIPWIHNVRNTDMVIAADDEDCMMILRLLNEKAGQEYLMKQGVKKELIAKLGNLGISSIGNMLCAIKFARYYELGKKDIVMTVFTDSAVMYQSRIKELNEQYGIYSEQTAVKDYHRHLMGQKTDSMLELSFQEKKRIHNLKYYTWIEQQGSSLEELNAQWNDFPEYWDKIQGQVGDVDRLIKAFNEKTGVLKELESQAVAK